MVKVEDYGEVHVGIEDYEEVHVELQYPPPLNWEHFRWFRRSQMLQNPKFAPFHHHPKLALPRLELLDVAVSVQVKTDGGRTLNLRFRPS